MRFAKRFLPAQLGPMIKPAENEEIMIDRHNAILVSSHKSVNIALDATINPILEPWRNFVIKAHQKFVLNPKASVTTARDAADIMRENFFPLLSTTYPHTKL